MVGVISTYFIMKDEIIWTAQFNYLYEVIVNWAWESNQEREI